MSSALAVSPPLTSPGTEPQKLPHLPWGDMEPEPAWRSRGTPGQEPELEASAGRMASKEKLYELWLLYFTKVSERVSVAPGGPA